MKTTLLIYLSLLALNAFAQTTKVEGEVQKPIVNCEELLKKELKDDVFTLEQVAPCFKEKVTYTTEEIKVEGSKTVTYQEIERLFNPETNEITETITKTQATKGNLGDSFAPNIALPIKKNNTSITSVDLITEANYKQVLSDKFLKFIEVLQGMFKEGYKVPEMKPEDKIIILSTADKDAATFNLPSGYSLEQVKYSYSNEKEAKNLTLAKNRGENTLKLITKFVPQLKAELFKVEAKDKQTERLVNIEDIPFTKLISSDIKTYKVKKIENSTTTTTTTSGDGGSGSTENVINKEKEKEKEKEKIPDKIVDKTENESVVVNAEKGKQQVDNKKNKKWLKYLAIGAGVAGAGFAVSKLVQRNKHKDNQTNQKNIPPAIVVDNSNTISAWKYIATSKKCIEQKMHKNLIDNKTYFLTQTECEKKDQVSPVVKPTIVAQTKPLEIKDEEEVIVKPKPKLPPPVEVTPEIDVSDLTDEQIIQIANSGQTNDNPMACQNERFKILEECNMRGYPELSIYKHPNYNISLKKGIVKLVGSSTLICQYKENAAKYTIILVKKCGE